MRQEQVQVKYFYKHYFINNIVMCIVLFSNVNVLFQDVFIRAVFSRRRAQSVATEAGAAGGGGAGGGEARGGCVPQPRADDDLHSPVRIIHKEQDSIAAFCLNRVLHYYYYNYNCTSISFSFLPQCTHFVAYDFSDFLNSVIF